MPDAIFTAVERKLVEDLALATLGDELCVTVTGILLLLSDGPPLLTSLWEGVVSSVGVSGGVTAIVPGAGILGTVIMGFLGVGVVLAGGCVVVWVGLEGVGGGAGVEQVTEAKTKLPLFNA